MEMQINAKELVNAIDWYKEGDEIKFIEKIIVDHGRWSVGSYYYFQIKDKFYKVYRSESATEMQDEDSWGEYGWDDVELTEVKKEKVMVEQWVEV